MQQKLVEGSAGSQGFNMGIRTAFKNAAATAINAFGDVAVSTNYWSLTSTGTFDASAGTLSKVYATTVNVKVIIDQPREAKSFELRSRASDFDFQVNDQIALVAANFIPGVEPKPDDVVSMDVSVSWTVVNVFTDPAEALWEVQIRRS